MAADILKSLFPQGVYVSFHSGKPGKSGGPILAGPFRIPNSSLATRNGKLTNPYIIELGESLKSGRATYAGIWISRTNFLGPTRLKRSLEVIEGASINLSRFGIQIGVSVVGS